MKIDQPNFTQVPNVVLDKMVEFTDIEFRIVMVVCRQSFGWHRPRAEMSLTQFEDWTGMSRPSVVKACEALVKRGVLDKQIEEDSSKSSYRLVVNGVNPPGKPGLLPLVNGVNPPIYSKEKEKEKGVFDLEAFNRMKTALLKIYRPDGRQMSNLEELLLRDIVKDHSSPEHELANIFKYKAELPDKEKKFFPTTLKSLLDKWDETLDRAHQFKQAKARQASCF